MTSRIGEAAWPAFDLLKCLCVVGMVLAHGIYWTWTVHGWFLLPPESSWRGAFQGGMFLGVFPLTLPLLLSGLGLLGAGARRYRDERRPSSRQQIGAAASATTP